MGCHSSRSNDLSVHARVDSTGYVRLLWESSEEDDENAAILEFGEKTEAEPRERTDDSLSSFLESAALAVEGSDLNTTDASNTPRSLEEETNHERTGTPVVCRDTRHAQGHGPVVCSSSSTRQLGCVFQDMEPPKLSFQ